MLNKNTFSTFDVLKILSIDRERLREWMNRGFVIPTSPAVGQGTKALFTILDVFKIALFKKLIEAGINRKKASILVKTNPRLDSLEDVKNINFILVIDKKEGATWINYLEPGPWTIEKDITEDESWNIGILINFKKLRKEIEGSI